MSEAQPNQPVAQEANNAAPADPAPPAELVSQTVSFWDANLRTVFALAAEVRQEYVSKDRLRRIAMLVIVQLAAMMEAARETEHAEVLAAEAAHAKNPTTNLILPETGLVIP